MHRWILFPILAALSGSGFAADSSGTIFEYSARPERSNNFAEASFSCIRPMEKPRAILFLAGGTDSDARPWLNDSRWRAFAEEEHLVLIAACLRGAGESYEVASKGTGQALLDAITAFATQSANPEIERLPLILYGHSAGAQFAFNFACWKPARVRAIVGVKSGPLPQPEFRETPPFRALFIVGEGDQPGRVREVSRAFAAGRSLGAPWCLVYQPNAGHDTQGCRELAEAFIRTINSTNSGGEGYAALSRPDQPLAMLGRTDPNYSWLPDLAFFQSWRSFVRGIPLQRLVTLADESSQEQLSWQTVTALPDRLDPSQAPVKFEYLVSLPDNSGVIALASIKTSNPAIHATLIRRSSRECTVVGECDSRGLPIGPLKSELDVEIQTATGIHKHCEHTLFAEVTGPISVSPSSLYYGVITRETNAEFNFAVASDAAHKIRSCEAISTDPQFLRATVEPSEKPSGYRIKCTIHSGSHIGPKDGRLTLRVESDREYTINVPFFGFVQK